ncbi:MAG TPA: penicillin-binding transpeptidase domain-containing protein, partial [Candidatus Eisenbacteria bacterium]|nr:penicillin-binding transpeptidase domain-containing protein [Candidatus Eisenbacteria bacterium]
KFRHSPAGRTDTPLEKFRQLFGASLKAYRQGIRTRAWREQIIVDYLNSVPLAAAPAYGEIHGLGEGLHAWFGMELAEVIEALTDPGVTPRKARAFKHVLALLISVRAPTVLLVEDRASLEHKVARFTRLMLKEGVIDADLASALDAVPIQFSPRAPAVPQPSSVKNKAANAIRTNLMELLGVANVYDLNRLHLEVQSTIDVPLQKAVTHFLHTLADPSAVKIYGLDGERLLEGKDPKKVIYSLLLVESTADGNWVRVQADNLSAPLDFNKSVKLELGSTAKLRTLTHYLELIAELHAELSRLDREQPLGAKLPAGDPLTRWAVSAWKTERGLPLEEFLARAMERKYSASPYEAFFTGGGLHYFENFDRSEDGQILTLREAFHRSTNLVFIRLMRDIVAYHRARLPYDADAVIADPSHPERRRMLQSIAEEEARAILRRAYQTYAGATPQQLMERLLGSRRTARHLAILFFAWKVGADENALSAWLAKHQESATAGAVNELFRAYSNPRLTLMDYAYLLSLHPLEVWCAGELLKDSRISWESLYGRSAEARSMSSAWLLTPRSRKAQDLRLRIRIERDAFARMTPYWQRLGFPFKTIVPSYATAIGSSSDRPVALAELLGILTNDGVRRRTTALKSVHFARGTPYETVFDKTREPGEPVLAPEVARTVKRAMAGVVERGTARRLKGAFKLADGRSVTIGGKTGSGDNRFETFNRYGGVLTSRATNRTAAFVFYIGDRYFGVITAYVQGREAADYRFTSALPVAILKQLAPLILAKLEPAYRDRPAPVQKTSVGSGTVVLDAPAITESLDLQAGRIAQVVPLRFIDEPGAPAFQLGFRSGLRHHQDARPVNVSEPRENLLDFIKILPFLHHEF